MEALTRGPRVALDDLLAAQRFTVRLGEQEQGLPRLGHSSRSEKARALTDDETIANNWREVADWKRKNLSNGRGGWFRW